MKFEIENKIKIENEIDNGFDLVIAIKYQFYK